MTALRYEASARRLRIEGECQMADLAVVREALETFTQLAAGHLIVDLTAAKGIDRNVADGLVAAAQRARDDGGTVVLLRKHGLSVDNALTDAERAARQK